VPPKKKRKDTGKLSRPSFMREELGSGQNLARDDIYHLRDETPELDERGSPIKKLPVMANKIPLKRRKKAKKVAVEKAQDDDTSEPPNTAAGQAATNPGTQESPPPTVPMTDIPSEKAAALNRRQSGRLAGEEASITEIEYNNDPMHTAQKRRRKRKADGQQLDTDQLKGSREVSRLVSVQIPVKVNRKLRAIPPKAPKIATRPDQTVKPSTRTRIPPIQDENIDLENNGVPDVNLDDASENENLEIISDQPKARGQEAIAPNDNTRKPRQKAKPSNTYVPAHARRKRSSPTCDDGTAPEQEDGLEASIEGEAEASDKVAPDAEETEAPVEETEAPAEETEAPVEEIEVPVEESSDYEDSEPISRIFKFLDTGGRSGSCRTDEGIAIAQACQVGQELVFTPDITLEEVSNTTVGIRTMLGRCGEGKSAEDLRAIKTDAYGYLFRHIAEYLEVLHEWFVEKFGDEQSLESLRIIEPLIQDIIRFKDTMASWKVTLPTRYKNDLMVKDVKAKFITPLQEVEKEYHTLLHNMEVNAKAKRRTERALQRAKDQRDEGKRRDEEAALRNKRWRVWQELHICRLENEPNPRLREHLQIDRRWFDALVEQGERDSNGVKFERVSGLKPRSLPHASRNLSYIDLDWTDEQLSALIDGLTKYAGTVLHRPFD
jgi:hypothetical protein